MYIVEIANEDWSVVVDLAHGAKLLKVTYKNNNVLQPYDKDLGDENTDNVSMFLLAPMSNRIEHNCYNYNGKTISFRPNTKAGEFVHGFAWKQSFFIVEKHANFLHLRTRVDDEFSGYHCDVDVIYTFYRDEFIATIRVIPDVTYEDRLIGLGFHPYFVTDENTTLQFYANGWYKPKTTSYLLEDLSFDIDEKFDFSKSKTIPNEFINHCYNKVNFINLNYSDHSLEIKTQNLDYLMMYRTANANFIALEPTSHEVNAFNKEGYGNLKSTKQGIIQGAMEIKYCEK